MTPKQLTSVSQSANLATPTVDPLKPELPTRDGTALAFDREEESWSVNRHTVYNPELMQVLDHHQPKRQQAFDEVKRLLDCGQTRTDDYAQAWADLDWHNQACRGAVRQYLAELN